MGKKRNAVEIDRRIHTVVNLLSSAKTNSDILRFCTEEWGYRNDKPRRTCNAQERSSRLTTQSNAPTSSAHVMLCQTKSSKPASAVSNTAMLLEH